MRLAGICNIVLAFQVHITAMRISRTKKYTSNKHTFYLYREQAQKVRSDLSIPSHRFQLFLQIPGVSIQWKALHKAHVGADQKAFF